MFNVISIFRADESLDLYTYSAASQLLSIIYLHQRSDFKIWPITQPFTSVPSGCQDSLCILSDANSGKILLVNGAVFDKILCEILLITSLDCQW
jgi:hypothetical protein